MELENPIYKPYEMLCGSACAYYLLSILKHDVDVPNNLFWITDIAFIFVKSGLNVQVSCFDSNLYNDFITKKLPSEHPAFLSIKQYLETGVILERKIDKTILYNITSPNSYLIASVKSSLLNNDESLDGYHYIIIYRNKTTYFIINPRKYNFYLQNIEVEFLINIINHSGNWIIQIKY